MIAAGIITLAEKMIDLQVSIFHIHTQPTSLVLISYVMLTLTKFLTLFHDHSSYLCFVLLADQIVADSGDQIGNLLHDLIANLVGFTMKTNVFFRFFYC